ncbi:unnamed protein product [Chrysoparadoxa australica]
MVRIQLFLPARQLLQLATLSRDWNVAVSNKMLWQELYHMKFGEAVRQASGHVASPKQAYRDRLDDPMVGDMLEALWEGQFRLSRLEQLFGRLWWAVQIIERLGDHQDRTYRVHFLGYSQSFTDTITRTMLRWPKGDHSVTQKHLRTGSPVEVKMQGPRGQEPQGIAAVPGSQVNSNGGWLLGTVKRVTRHRVLVESSHDIWVRRESCRCLLDGESSLSSRHRLRSFLGPSRSPAQGIRGALLRGWGNLVGRCGLVVS